MKTKFARFVMSLVVVGATTSSLYGATQGVRQVLSVRETLRISIEQLMTQDDPRIDGVPIATAHVIAEVYQRRDFETAWDVPVLRRQLLNGVRSVANHGLNPRSFHLADLEELLSAEIRRRSPPVIAKTEIVCTDALISLVVALHFGTLDPETKKPKWTLDREVNSFKPIELFDRALRGESIDTLISNAAPDLVFYRQLKRGLATHKEIASIGGWPTVPSGPMLSLGDHGRRVLALVKRLDVSGELSFADVKDPTIFDEDLEDAVLRFQIRHGIDRDGKVGPGTLRELNVPVGDRIKQIEANLERMRWVARDMKGDYLVADLAGGHVYLMEDESELWGSKIRVGSRAAATPVCRGEMRYLVINPTWTVPPDALRREIIPRLRRNPAALNEMNMSVLDGNGRFVDPTQVNWASISERSSFPYTIRQEPGSANFLGRVKFMFPNQHSIVLHDTPSRSFFDSSVTEEISGCICILRSLELAERLLDDDAQWTRQRIYSTVSSGKTTTVSLPEPLRVIVQYWTAEADSQGKTYFRPDTARRDAPVIEGLAR
jgi:murein L,D-transpeptidase YcbB/YkuD